MSVSFLNNSSPLLSRRLVIGGILCALVDTRLGESPVAAAVTPTSRSFVETQKTLIAEAIATKDDRQILRNRYLASCIYYSDAFCKRVSNPVYQIDVPTKIVGSVAHLLTTDVRQWAAAALQQHTESVASISEVEHQPLARFSFGHGTNHSDAVDLFTAEGSAVYAFAGGVVMVADSMWKSGDEYSSASMKGGNTVIVFNHEKGEFYRYAHLETVSVSPGMVIKAGGKLGTVGDTGKNASKPGHGGHLHFEINAYDARGYNKVVPASTLAARIRAVR